MTVLRAAIGAVALLLLAAALAPVALLLAACLLLADATCRRRRTPAPPAPTARDTSRASILVLTWNGAGHLRRLLPSLRVAVQRAGGEHHHQVVVVDNGSTDDTAAVLAAEPWVEVVRHARNEGFVRGYNLALPQARHDVVVLLNNDMVVAPGFIAELLAALAAAPRAFAVTAAVEVDDGDRRGLETGLTRGVLSLGMLKLRHLPAPDDSAPPCLWAGGGSSAFDRRLLLALGGFDPLFAPYYFEDTDLSWRAWRLGHEVRFAPRARVQHAHQGTTRRLPRFHLARVQRRNAWLFLWRGFDGWRFTLPTALLLPLTAVRAAARHRLAGAGFGAAVELAAVGSALARLQRALRGRRQLRRAAALSAAEAWRRAHGS